MADLEGGTTLSLDRHLGASDTAEPQAVDQLVLSSTEAEEPDSRL